MDLAAWLQRFEDMVRDAKSMPLSSSALLNRDEVLELIEQMKDAIPEEVKQARWVVKDREELLAKARRDAEAMVEQARAEQLRMASHEAVVERANEEAERIVHEAEDEARRLRLEAEDYIDAKLAQLEVVLHRILEDLSASGGALSRTIDQIQAGREKLRGAAPAASVELGAEAVPFEGEEA